MKTSISSLILAVMALAAVSGPARAEDGVVVELRGTHLDVTIEGQVDVVEAVDRVAEAVNAQVDDSELDGTVGPLRLVDVSLHQALAQIMPGKAFVIKYAEGSETPESIIFSSGGGQVAAAAEPQNPQLMKNILNGRMAAPAVLGNLGQPQVQKSNDIFSKIKLMADCANLMKLPQNRGKDSASLQTAEGNPCPPNLGGGGLQVPNLFGQ